MNQSVNLPSGPAMTVEAGVIDARANVRRIPLAVQVIGGFAVGAVLGAIFGQRPIIAGVGTAELGDLGMLVIRLLKTLALPLVLFAILQAILKAPIARRQAARLIFICAGNAAVAITLGLVIMNTFQPGKYWNGRMTALVGDAAPNSNAPASSTSARPTLDPLKNLAGYIPENVLQPFIANNIISVILMGLLGGFAMRRVKETGSAAAVAGIGACERGIAAVYETLVQILSWIVRAVPFAVLGLVAQAVGRSGLAGFSLLWIFVAVIVGGLMIHGAIYYPLLAWACAGKSPRQLFMQGADALMMGVSTNSSLATVPTTLHCLTRKMDVSEQSARLSACVGTNLNNDGITLYEAMAVLFLAQAFGIELSLGMQLAVVAASIMAAIGVAGVPEAGLIVLPLVLGAAGLPEWIIAAAIPLILPVDWFVARARSGVNVMSDMVGALLLDGNPRRERRAS